MDSNVGINILKIDTDQTAKKIEEFVEKTVIQKMKKKGAVLGISGGIDSSVTAAICVNALSKEKVHGLLMPEKESEKDSLKLGKMLSDFLSIDSSLEDISPILDSLKCYKKRNDAIKRIIPEYAKDWKFKIVLPSLLDSNKYRIFHIIARSPKGEIIKKRLNHRTYMEILSATNFKQRVRKMMEYYYANKLDYAVIGTPNRLEYDQGFFVKNGDGAADIKPMAHLYKTQVYQLADYYKIPDIIKNKPPTTDTYSMPQSQEEFFFSVPYNILDFCLYCYNHDINVEKVANEIELTPNQINRIYEDIQHKRNSSKYLHLSPQTYEKILPD